MPKADENHVCKPEIYCNCWPHSDEPKESCVVHGFGVPRCQCGRFVKGYYYYEPKKSEPNRDRGRAPE